MILYLINTLYFKAPWSDPFHPGATQPGPFMLPDGSRRTLPMMSQTGRYRYYRGPAYEAISLPYASSKVAMSIILPAASSGLRGFQDSLGAAGWATLLANLKAEMGTIVLPRFTVSYDVRLNAALSALGMGIAFDPRQADLSGMVQLGGERAYISEVQHKTVLKVSESGHPGGGGDLRGHGRHGDAGLPLHHDGEPAVLLRYPGRDHGQPAVHGGNRRPTVESDAGCAAWQSGKIVTAQRVPRQRSKEMIGGQRVTIGIVGCGAIAQAQHLPNLVEQADLWNVAAVCDVSPGLVEAVGDRFGVPRRYTDYRALLASEVDAVLLCHADPKTVVALAAARAGKHMLIEKPMCWTVAEADEIVQACAQAGTVAMVGYMKQHEAGYQYARERILAMRDLRFIQVNHLHPDNALHLQDFRILQADVPAEAREELERLRAARLADALGAGATPAERYAFHMLIGSMIHDISSLRGIFGPPERVVSAHIWGEGHGFSTMLAYSGERRCVASWVDLPDLWDFKETLEVYGAEERIMLRFPTGFSRGLPVTVTLQGSEQGVPWTKEMALARDPGFQAELAHFHQCIVAGQPPLTGVEGARADVALVHEIIRAARRG